MNERRDLDLVIWGANTRYTGRLVAEHLAQHYDWNQTLRSALGGRDHARLEQLAAKLGSPSDPAPILVGDSHDRERLNRIACRTSVV
jgi:short subunit dehydrogenase-like uncharacterized protein